jgi:predicted Na+-dependent transporter
LDVDGTALDTLVGVSTLVFVVTSMIAMGLSLTVRQVLDSLSNGRLVVLALLVNFVAVPAVAYGIDLVLDLDESLFIGLVLIAVAGGAPFLPKLVQVAKGDAAFSVGLMVLLMVATVVVMPLALPLLLEGVEVNAWDIASSLIFLMILPLGISLFVRARYPDHAQRAVGSFGTVSSVAMAFLAVGGIIANWSEVVSLIGTRGILAAALLIAVAFVLGFAVSGRDPGTRSVMGLGAGQRNLSAAFVVAVQNFSDDADILAFVIVAGVVGLVLLMAGAAEIGRRRAAVD